MTDKQWAIRADGVSKKFGLTLRQAMKYGLVDIFGKLFGYKFHTDFLRDGEFWAVEDISFEVNSGEALGIMGVNGCGKTTLLRILNGVYAPDAGRVQMRGRVGALIAAGAGFVPMLSGRENVYVNGTLLGLSTKEIDGLMDEIVAFSELGQFIDLPVRNYSSGMYVRLGFAIAALSSPDVLLMDEVLAVGDLNFQKKCFDHILKLKRQGTAIILVSHSPGAIWSVCDRGLFMDQGNVLVDGAVEDIIRSYDDQNSRNAMSSEKQFSSANRHSETNIPKIKQNESGETSNVSSSLVNYYGHSQGGTGDATCVSVRLLSTVTEDPIDSVAFGEPLLLEFRYRINKQIDNPIFRSSIDAVHYKFIVSLDSYEQGLELKNIGSGDYTLRVFIKEQNLRPGMYQINTSIVSRHVGVHIFYWVSALSFIITHPNDKFLYSNDKAILFLGCDLKMEKSE